MGGIIGVVIGAVGMGVLNANRPEPIFSSANEGLTFNELCGSIVSAIKVVREAKKYGDDGGVLAATEEDYFKALSSCRAAYWAQ